jgi:hypothetical protein
VTLPWARDLWPEYYPDDVSLSSLVDLNDEGDPIVDDLEYDEDLSEDDLTGTGYNFSGKGKAKDVESDVPVDDRDEEDECYDNDIDRDPFSPPLSAMPKKEMKAKVASPKGKHKRKHKADSDSDDLPDLVGPRPGLSKKTRHNHTLPKEVCTILLR